MFHKMAFWLVLIISGILLLNGVMYLMQPGMAFLPLRTLEATPADWGLAFDDVTLTTEDGVELHGWFVPGAAGRRQAVLFLHGNAGNISHRRESVELFYRLGAAVLIIDYRGYGRSAGSPSEQGLYRDARAAWHHLVTERGYAPREVTIFGRSLGGVIAAQLASEIDPGGLIVESSLTSARDFARQQFPLLSRLVVQRYRFDAQASIARARSPVLVLHSPDDDIVPFTLGERLYRAAPEPKTFVRLRGDHNTGFSSSRPAYDQALAAFLDKAAHRHSAPRH